MKRLFYLIALLTLPLYANEGYVVGELDNGIHYYVRSHRESHVQEMDDEGASVNRAALRLVVPVGSVFEEEGEEGVAHWLEHMMFRGTQNFEQAEIEGFLEEIGGAIGPDANAYTGFEETVYMLDVPVEGMKYVETGLRLMAEWVSCATISDSDVEAERQIVLEERRLGLGCEERVVQQVVEILLDGAKHADRLPIGKLDVLERAKAETVRNFYEKWYQRAPVGVVAVGDFDTEEVVQIIEREFGRVGERIRREEMPSFHVPLIQGGETRIIHDPELTDGSVGLIFAHRPWDFTGEGAIETEVLLRLLDHLMVGRLTRLAELDLLPAPAKWGYAPIVGELAITSLDLDVGPDRCPEALSALIREFRRIQAYGFTEGEYQTAIANLHQMLSLEPDLEEFQGNAWLAQQCIGDFLGQNGLVEQGEHAQLALEALANLSPDHIDALLRSYDLNNHCLTLVALPEPTGDLLDAARAIGETTPIEPLVDSETIDDYTGATPPPGEIVELHLEPELNLTTVEFQNGIRLLLLPTSNRRPMVEMTATATGGLSEYSGSDLHAARLVPALISESSIGKHSPSSLSHFLAGKNVGLNTTMDVYNRTINGNASSADIETLFQLFHMLIDRQENRPEAHARIVARQIERTAEESRDPATLFDRETTKMNTLNHPFFKPATAQDLQELTFEQVDRIARENFCQPSAFTFVLVGDFDPQFATELAQIYLGSLATSDKPNLPYRPLDVGFPESVGELELHSGLAEKSTVQLTFPISLYNPTPEAIDTLEAARGVVQSRTHNLLRSSLSSTYTTAVQVYYYTPETTEGRLFIEFSCDPLDAHLLSQMVLRELRLLKMRGTTTEEVLHQVRNTQRAIVQSMDTNIFWTTELLRTLHFGWDLNALHNIPARTDALTTEAIDRQLQEMLTLDRHTLSILYPEQG